MASATRSGLLRTQAWIGGRWRTAISENTFPVYNPATNEVVAEVSKILLILFASRQISVIFLLPNPPPFFPLSGFSGPVTQVPDMGAEDVAVAVQDAYSNQKLWANTTVKVGVAGTSWQRTSLVQVRPSSFLNFCMLASTAQFVSSSTTPPHTGAVVNLEEDQ